MKNNWSRRKFIRDGTRFLAILAGALTFGKRLSFAHAPNVSSQSQSQKIPNSILVTYESQFGSTAEVVEVIGQELSQKGHTVTVKKMNQVTHPERYSQVVLGSAIQYDKWMPEARNFAKAHQETLSKMPVSCFFVCLVLSKGTTKSKKKAHGYALKISELVPNVEVQSIGQFAGVLDYGKMSFGQRLAAKTLFAIIGVKEGDYRNWAEIREWGRELF